jgi:hypothetical protein
MAGASQGHVFENALNALGPPGVFDKRRLRDFFRKHPGAAR